MRNTFIKSSPTTQNIPQTWFRYISWLHAKRLIHGWTKHLKSTIELHLKLKAAELKEQPYLWSRLRLHNIREVRECSQAYPLMERATTDHLDKSIFATPALYAVISVVISLRILAVRASAYHAHKC